MDAEPLTTPSKKRRCEPGKTPTPVALQQQQQQRGPCATAQSGDIVSGHRLWEGNKRKLDSELDVPRDGLPLHLGRVCFSSFFEVLIQLRRPVWQQLQIRQRHRFLH
ncbi:hypothetical protein Efla_000158 [Eimeria flavescens]